MKKEIETDFELNIASIVDCLTVLITYLLASATFLTLGVMAVSVPSFTDEGSVQKTPEISLTIQLRGQNQLKLVTEGRETSSVLIPFGSLSTHLRGFKDKHPGLASVVVSGADTITYREIVKVVEVARKTFSEIAISTEEVTP